MRFTFPEAELRNQYDTNPDGSVGPNRTPYAIRKAIDEGTRKRDYSNITSADTLSASFPACCTRMVAILSFYAAERGTVG